MDMAAEKTPPLLDRICREVLEPAGMAWAHRREAPPAIEGPAPLPWITATWAQSLDARLAGPGGKTIAISGGESFAMTHYIRHIHDAILVGVGTVRNDNPRLNARINSLLEALKEPALGEPVRNPRPVILDASFAIPLDCHLLTHRETVRPWVVVDPAAATAAPDKVRAIEALGGRVLAVANARTDVRGIFARLYAEGLRSVMVEGGVVVLSHVLEIATAVIVTVAPRFIGGDAPRLVVSGNTAWGSDGPLASARWTTLGSDTVLVASRPPQ
ncbi:hypothetical protein H9P43_000728 [Blastocladiella emersonii ATCC 22665]|nr:hypothetical protein H9P43_000728 [Blastocladiella emersonii ATCC 22665]